MKRQLKRETPKNYSFLDLVAPSYNRVKITPKFAEGGDPTMTEPTMFMPPQSLNSGQPAFVKNPNVFDWSIQEYVDPGNRLWAEHKKLYPNDKDGSKEHEYFLCNLNPQMCGGPNPQFRGMRTSKNPEVQSLVKELDPLFDIPGSKKYPYSLENFLSHGSRNTYRPNISETSKTGLFNFNKDQEQKLQRLYDLSLQESGNTVIPDSKYPSGYRIQWNSPTDRYYKNQANNMYAANENLANSLDNWNNRSVSNEPFPIAKQMERYPNASKFFFDGAPLNTTQVNNSKVNTGAPSNMMRVPNYLENEILDNPVSNTNTSFIAPLNPKYIAPKSNGFSMTNPYTQPFTSPLEGLQNIVQNSRLNQPTLDESSLGSDVLPYTNTLEGLQKIKEQERLNEPILDESSLGPDVIPDNSVLDALQRLKERERLNEPELDESSLGPDVITNNEPTNKTENKETSTITAKYSFNPYTTASSIINAGLNTIGGMRNMKRINRQENLNSFITQQPEAVYPNKRMLYGDKSMFAEYGGEYSNGGMYPDGGSVYDPDAYVGELVQYKKGGIYIKPENKGKFTAWAQSHGMSVQEAASHVMANKEKYSSTTVKRANFAKNASKWKHEDGGMVEYGNGGYVVTKSNDRKGKTHKVTGPDGTVKYFGDSKMGQHPGDPDRKAAFYARHKSNLKNNPHFRAFARKTWEEGGEIDNDKEMVEGVADILSRVNNVDNRKELANYMVNQFDDENVDYDYDQFLQATNLVEMAYGGMYPYGGSTLPPIFTSNRNDPRLRNYNDSATLYNAYNFQRNNYKPIYETWLNNTAKDFPGGKEALREAREKNIGKLGKVSKTKKDRTSNFKNKMVYDDLMKEEKPIVDYYKSLVNDNKDFKIGIHSSPDLWHRTINPIGSFYDGIANSPIYKQPVQPIIYREDESLEPIKEPAPVLESMPVIQKENKNIPGAQTIWYRYDGPGKIHTNIGKYGSSYMTEEELDKYMLDNPNNNYSAQPNSVGYIYKDGKVQKFSYGGHYIPQDVPYLAGKFVPNRIDLEILANGGMIKRADGSYSKRGLWDNIRANKGSGKKPTKEMLKQERKIKKSYKAGGEYMEGNEYEISGEELERLRSLGYDVELI